MILNDIRKFNALGEGQYRQLLTRQPSTLAEDLAQLIEDPTYVVKANIPNFAQEMPDTRKGIGQLLYPYLGPGRPYRGFASDKNLWNWLSAAYLSSLGTAANTLVSRGSTKDVWVLGDDSKWHTRNVMLSAYFVYENHVDDPSAVSLLLDRTLDVTLGEYGSAILSTADIAYSVGARVANRLYLDIEKGLPKVGASSKNPGSVRRLTAAFLNQIKLNVDFKAMEVEQIIALLPPEFDKFISGEASSPEGKDYAFDEEDLRRQVGLG